MPHDKNNYMEEDSENLMSQIDEIFKKNPGLEKKFNDQMNQIIINYLFKKIGGESNQQKLEQDLENEIEMLKAALNKSFNKIKT